MTFSQVIRFLAVCSIIGGFFRAAMTPFALALGLDSIPELICGVLGTLFMGIGMFGVYFLHLKKFGKLGFAAFALHSVGSFLIMALVFDSLTFKVYEPSMLQSPMPPWPVAVTGMTSMPIIILSMILFPISIFRTKLYSKLSAILLLLTPVLNFMPYVSDVGPLLWGAAFVLYGIEAWKQAAPGRTPELTLERVGA
ncbi:hypothetical protein J19TS2_38080 [Cohnella xylanilytica]|uniref:Uncharacterized protein n=1 Tax=Cohnella xylanilytica TaxID=557555 RepID=A0A841U932_9BACL|nr:hypothetical protein [Cohnella xylanilytica]MBB6694614.1 hypothetical protein [Cohnella xylanilytica]GIO14253.1 hypothetical protein J19TS2_38080 [Cohnella xylanilytica]